MFEGPYTKEIFEEEYTLGMWIALWVPVWGAGTVVQKTEDAKKLTDPTEVAEAKVYVDAMQTLMGLIISRNVDALIDNDAASALEGL